MSSSNENKGQCSIACLKPLTKNNILYFYVPLESLVAYAALSVNITNPSVAIKIFPRRDLTNFLMIHTMFGTTLYLYSRPHLQALPTNQRIGVSLVGSTLFSFGSVLVWAVIRSSLPRDQSLLTTVLGVASGAAIVKLATDYFRYVDSTVAKK